MEISSFSKPIQKFEELKKKSLSEDDKKENEFENLMATKTTDFKRLGLIGQGSSGFVEKAIYIPKNLVVALKV